MAKMGNLCITYLRNRKKGKGKSDAGATGVKPVSWGFYSALRILDDAVTGKQTQSNLDEVETDL